MKRNVWFNELRLLAIMVGSAVLLGSPAAAQRMSEGHQFLEAVRDRDGTVATELLDEPGSTVVNSRDITNGETALHIATQRRDLVWIRFLTQRGANPNFADKAGVTPLQTAIGLGYVEGAEALLNAGADVEQASNTGETPLIAAVLRRDAGLVRLLLAKGASPDRADNSGRTPRDYAALMTGRTAIAEAIDEADRDRRERDQVTYGPSF